MRAYVIKNKEGRYFEWFDSLTGKCHFSKKPIKFLSFNKEKDAKRIRKFYGLKNCSVVEIIIAEGDLEKQIRADERSKVCEEIRKTIKYFQQQVPVWLVMEELDKIEKGETE